MADLKAWMANRTATDERLYERYGKPLEAEHKGKFVAIGPGGQTILGTEELAVALEAEEKFGAGNFALRRIGYHYNVRWRHAVV